jgi:hypothetical protein
MAEPPVHLGPHGYDAHPHKTGRGRLDLVIALSAIFISGVSLFVAIEHGRTERDLVASNSWPFLRAMVTNQYGVHGELAIGLNNGGVGPAKVKTFEVFYRGAPVRSAMDLLRRCCGLAGDDAAARAELHKGILTSNSADIVLRPGEENAVVVVQPGKASPALAARFNDALHQITFRACYCSVLDECWRGALRSTQTVPVKTCPAAATPFDANAGR